MFSEEFIRKIKQVYKEKGRIIPGLFHRIDRKIQLCGPSEQILLMYLYGNMPLSDMVNYPFETFLDYARHGVFLWENGIYRAEAGEEIFCQYVVYHRINTEDISPCRSFFYEKAKGEVPIKAAVEDAVLALNYWCAQEASYRASDDRTASPMTVYKSARGRCGEESTFTVSVLRSMGIPARQVYAPRWSHCDDNHAWVEAWCKGTWHFLGACEPEEVLDKGWFLHASSRAMLIHSRWYGDLLLAGDVVCREDIVSTQGITTEINEIKRYAHTRRVTVKVIDAEGRPGVGAKVRIEVLNYAEFFPVAKMLAGEEGKVDIELGLGSCRIRGSLDNAEDSYVLDVRECSEVTLALKKKWDVGGQEENKEDCQGRRAYLNGWKDFQFFAPRDAVIHSGFVTEEQKKQQKSKLAARTAARLEKKGTGNEEEVSRFLSGSLSKRGRPVVSLDSADYRKLLIETLSEKDLLDLKAEILEAHLKHALQYKDLFPGDIFVKYILAPRIFNEMLTDYRGGIDGLLSKKEKEAFKADPVNIWRFIRHGIEEAGEAEYSALLTCPLPCLTYKAGSRQSQEILFVAVCRTLGIPARLNPIDGEMEYYKEGAFVKVICPEKEGKLKICMEEGGRFVYFQNWTVARVSGDEKKLLDLSGINFQSTAEISVPAGIYEVITANRLPNGNVLGRMAAAAVCPDCEVALDLKLKEARLDQMLECVPIPSFTVKNQEGEDKVMGEVLGGRPALVAWLTEGQEPTEHILNELCERGEEFNQVENPIILFVNNKAALEHPTVQKALALLDHVEILYDSTEERVSELGRRFYVDPESAPLILVTDKNMNCVYAASGYNVGTADMILKILKIGEAAPFRQI